MHLSVYMRERGGEIRVTLFKAFSKLSVLIFFWACVCHGFRYATFFVSPCFSKKHTRLVEAKKMVAKRRSIRASKHGVEKEHVCM